MTRENVINRYFRWLCDFVSDSKYTKSLSYDRLFRYLFSVEFTYTIGMDGNRAEDGIALRYRFADKNNIPYPIVAAYLDDHPCSVLEMMIALAIRCENQIMEDLDIGNRTGQWFWNMVVSLGLGHMTGSSFDEEEADSIMDIFLNRKYSRDGKGSLFTVYRSKIDMRTTEIWYQMNEYLRENYGT